MRLVGIGILAAALGAGCALQTGGDDGSWTNTIDVSVGSGGGVFLRAAGVSMQAH